MAKKNNKLQSEQSEVEVNEEVNQPSAKAEAKQPKKEQKNKKAKKQNTEPKRNKAKEAVAELKKVTWPTFGDVVKNTLIVLGIVVACTLALFAIDRVLSWLYQLMVYGNVINWL